MLSFFSQPEEAGLFAMSGCCCHGWKEAGWKAPVTGVSGLKDATDMGERLEGGKGREASKTM